MLGTAGVAPPADCVWLWRSLEVTSGWTKSFILLVIYYHKAWEN